MDSPLKIVVESVVQNTSRRVDCSDVLHTLRIPCSLVWKWKESSKSYGSLVNDGLDTIKLRESCKTVEQRLRVKVSKMNTKLSLKSGRARLRYLNEESVLFDLFEDEVVYVSELTTKVKSLEAKEDEIQNESLQKDETVENLQAELVMKNDLLKSPLKAVNQGKTYEEVKDRQKARKLRAIKTAAEQALWFVRNFGLTVEKVVLKSPQDHKVDINYADIPSTSTGICAEQTAEPESVSETLYLLEKFGVSDECYHELTMLHPSLPRSYKVKAVRNDISHNIELLPLPSHAGAYRPIKACIKLILADKLPDGQLLSSIQVKFSGDGASFSKSTNYVLLSFSFPSLCKNVLAGVAVKSAEKYEVLKKALEPLFSELNELIEEQEITIDERTIKLEIIFGGDMKFLLLAMGMNAANSNYACLWCKIHKSNRWDMSVSNDQYNGENMRMLHEMKECVKQKGIDKKKGCIDLPLIDIEPKNCVPDELHLFLRITDIIFNSLFEELVKLDHKSKVHKTGESDHVQRAVRNVRRLGISFNVWMSEGTPGKHSRSALEMTPLNRNERLKVLKNLPSNFDDLLPNSTAVSLAKLWMDFSSIYDELSSAEPDVDLLEGNAEQWINDFLAMSNVLEGHQKSCVTPYIHVFAYHVPDTIRRYGSVRQLSGQGVEKNNDDAKRHYYSGNCHNAARDILPTEARIEHLERESPGCVREKRSYVKHNRDYWESDILEQRRSKRPPVSHEI